MFDRPYFENPFRKPNGHQTFGFVRTHLGRQVTEGVGWPWSAQRVQKSSGRDPGRKPKYSTIAIASGKFAASVSGP